MPPTSEQRIHTLKIDSAKDLKHQTTIEHNMDISIKYIINVPIIHERFNELIMKIIIKQFKIDGLN